MAEQKVLDVVGIRGVGVLHQLADHPVGGGAEQDLGMPATVLYPPHLAHLGDWSIEVITGALVHYTIDCYQSMKKITVYSNHGVDPTIFRFNLRNFQLFKGPE